MTRPSLHFPPDAPRSTFPIVYERQQTTVDQYLDRVAAKYRAGCYLEDLTCKRLAAIAMVREVSARLGGRITYKAARRLLDAA
ncbi:MAG TPA: hypothetical protein PKJ19_08140 [Flavobacteriales bacterium]|nr:hypothetical protein [Flavobacteriales bacterium]